MAIIDFPTKGNAMGIEDTRVEQRCSIQGREMSCPHIPIIREWLGRALRNHAQKRLVGGRGFSKVRTYKTFPRAL